MRRISDGECFHGIRSYQNLSGFCFGSCLVQRSQWIHCRTDWRKRCRKSTTINAALGLIQKEDGVVSILDREELDRDIKEQIGVVFDGSNYPEILSPRKLNRVMKNIYRTWDEQVYLRLLKQFSLPSDKQIKQFSKGMKMKLAISAALSHH